MDNAFRAIGLLLVSVVLIFFAFKDVKLPPIPSIPFNLPELKFTEKPEPPPAPPVVVPKVEPAPEPPKVVVEPPKPEPKPKVVTKQAKEKPKAKPQRVVVKPQPLREPRPAPWYERDHLDLYSVKLYILSWFFR